MFGIRIDEDDHVDEVLSGDLGFHASDGGHPRHSIHAFAAKFPPQLPAWFIERLTEPGNTVFDPFLGSGTTVVEAMRLHRVGVGLDIDPLAVLMSRVKTFSLDASEVVRIGRSITFNATQALNDEQGLQQKLQLRFSDKKDREFIDYWFLPKTALELEALIEQIETVEELLYRQYFLVVFSSIIVTKSGGVSMARDLAHSRPHRVMDKVPKSAIESLDKRLTKLLPALAEVYSPYAPRIEQGDVRAVKLPDESVDLIVTSPPYANAIDYVRANKFSLVWMGRPLKELSILRSNYIGTESKKLYDWGVFPPSVIHILETLKGKDKDKAGLLARYYWDMLEAMKEMYRVLKPGKSAFIVVGTSTMRGIDVETPFSLAEIAKIVGFSLRGVVERSLDRDRRMMPARWGNKETSIEERMHSEHVIGITKPKAKENVSCAKTEAI